MLFRSVFTNFLAQSITRTVWDERKPKRWSVLDLFAEHTASASQALPKLIFQRCLKTHEVKVLPILWPTLKVETNVYRRQSRKLGQ